VQLVSRLSLVIWLTPFSFPSVSKNFHFNPSFLSFSPNDKKEEKERREERKKEKIIKTD